MAGEKMRASADAFRGRLRSELTPEQQQKLDAFDAARRTGRGRHGRRGPRPAFLGDADDLPLGGLGELPLALEDEGEGPTSR